MRSRASKTTTSEHVAGGRAAGGHAVLEGGPLLIAHRGGAGLAPENTLTAFRQAQDVWQADMFELDVHTSADGRCVVIHDATLDRTTDGRGPVASYSLAALRRFDAGYSFTTDGGRTYPFRGQGIRVPTIDDVLEAFPRMRLTVELKTAAAQRPLFDAIDRFKATDRVIVAGERRGFRTEISRFSGCISACREDALPFYFLHLLHASRFGRLRADVVQMSEHLGGRRALTPRLVHELHEHGIHVHVWTINDEADMNRLLGWGVDGIVTDRPDRLARVLHERLSRPLPPGLRQTEA